MQQPIAQAKGGLDATQQAGTNTDLASNNTNNTLVTLGVGAYGIRPSGQQGVLPYAPTTQYDYAEKRIS